MQQIFQESVLQYFALFGVGFLDLNRTFDEVIVDYLKQNVDFFLFVILEP